MADRDPAPSGSGGYVVVTSSWPSMLCTIWGDDEQGQLLEAVRETGLLLRRRRSKKDEDGGIWAVRRVDGVMNVSSHRLSTTEIESALASHPEVAEAAVVGAWPEDTGQAVCAFVILREDVGDADLGYSAGMTRGVS